MKKIDILKIGSECKPWVLCSYNTLKPKKFWFFFTKKFKTAKLASVWCQKHKYEITAIF